MKKAVHNHPSCDILKNKKGELYWLRKRRKNT